MIRKVLFFLTGLTTIIPVAGAQENTIFDEKRVPDYQLPELLVSEDGEKINNAEEWIEVRRPEIIDLFEKNLYGKIPGTLELSSWEIIEESQNALNGKAIRKQVLLTFNNNGKQVEVNLLILLPKNIKKAPLFVLHNFHGNHTVVEDPEVIVPTSWTRNSEKYGVTDNSPTEKSRGLGMTSYSARKVIDAGYGLATMFYGDVDPDKYGEVGTDFSDGVHPLLYKKGQTKPLPNEWGAIAAWAWGLSRAMDYFEKDNDIDPNRVIVMGHSRLGKAALWAGALDERFAMVISNNSGAGGAALSRRKYGERLGRMSKTFPHWFSQNLAKYDDHEDAMPVDQHMLIALIAPRPVYVASGKDDQWADPKGEYLSVYHASPVYDLFGKTGFSSNKMPEVNQPIMTTTGYHMRSGGHGLTAYDWEQFIKFADLHLKR